MELADLPYDCLSYIFDCIPDLKSLFDLSTVCKQWNILVKLRLKKIRHLHVESEDYLSYVPFSSDNHIYTADVELMERVNVSQLLPNLKFLSLRRHLYGECTGKMVVNILSSAANPLVGLMCETTCGCCNLNIPSLVNWCLQVKVDEIVKHCGSLEYMTILEQFFLDSYFSKYKFGQNLKYFDGFIREYEVECLDEYECEDEDKVKDKEDEDYYRSMLDIKLLCRCLKKTPNLEVLLLGKPQIEPRLWPLPKMKLKEIRFDDISSSSPVFQFLPLFPDLRSIELNIQLVRDEDEDFPDSHTHLNVQDVVLKTDAYVSSPVRFLNLIKRIMVKFPNCKNFFVHISQELSINNEDLIEIIKNVPNLTLLVLDIKNWGDANTNEKLNEFCKSTDRRINFILRGDDQTSDQIRARSHTYTRYALNEDVSSPLKIDNEFLQKFVY